MADDKTFQIQIEGVGAFEFRHRRLRDEMRVAAEYSRLTEGVDNPPAWFDQLARMVATVKILTVKGPEGWDVDAMDPLDGETYATITKVYAALRDKEDFFRSRPGQGGETAGAATGGER